jgi:glycine dehydrogenase subunit 2
MIEKPGLDNTHYSRRLLSERSVPGRVGSTLPNLDVPPQDLPDSSLLREDLRLPEVSEGEVVRYFSQLSQLNFSVDTHFYPLGSCTMKYNPKVHEAAAQLPGLSDIHPSQESHTVQGTLNLLFHLQEYLSEITGMAGTSLSPMAGAQGELCGILIIRSYHNSLNDPARKTVLIPDSAHGTNPASAAMGGFRVVSVPSNSRGDMDLDALRELANNEMAGIMLTLPNTLGLFDPNIEDICKIVHEAGGLVYGDGANMNALLARVKLGELGFDVVHLNLHKTFSTPHGGGGPGAGPICVNSKLLPFLPFPIIKKEISGDYVFHAPSKTIGKVGAFHGNFGVLLRAYAYIRMLGANGLHQVSGNAVINANYLLARLKNAFHLPYDRKCMHEVVLSAKQQKTLRPPLTSMGKSLHRGIGGMDIAKRLLDKGFHAPTMYFPLIVDEALMIEPTETEGKETLDAFIEAMLEIAEEAVSEPDLLLQAPHTTPVSRLDEARAARQPDLRWRHV